MKYRRLTKEQFEELHKEFINFLATQSITAEEWKDIKENKPEVAEEELDLFSDLIWEGVLDKVRFIENIGPTQMHLFAAEEKEMKLIAIRVNSPSVDLTTAEGFAWFKQNFMGDQVEVMTAAKKYGDEPNRDKFELIEKGGVITKGELYTWFEEILP
ncbi:hypothetical protein E7Z59_07495 [Robertkochia marina]|uniref:Histidyl-tRNA synthetase n=1 Tax=Robertkochia marina TaxID=1227945 RepID=A0A4S3M0D5_9FLAO|nr:DUF6495 family protein [Robertkochia marina]THD67497.1 hypothetical protein E7Z59_07495 [Robertkochia marina]TRZ44636.1 hypothetical protein D3A96_08455 [Robertkochia marina]